MQLNSIEKDKIRRRSNAKCLKIFRFLFNKHIFLLHSEQPLEMTSGISFFFLQHKASYNELPVTSKYETTNEYTVDQIVVLVSSLATILSP